MRFRKGEHHPHPRRGPARHPYHVSEAARRARRQSLSNSRLRSDRETLVIKLLIWQSRFDGGPHPSQRALARQLGVSPSYVAKIQLQSAQGLDALGKGTRVSLDDLYDARRFTARLREQEPGMLAPATQSPQSRKPRVLTDDEIIAENWREAREWKRKNLHYGGRGWFRW